MTPLVCPSESCVRASNLLLLVGESTSAVVDLSKATRLRDMVFLCGRGGASCVAMTLRAVTSNHTNLRQITLYVPHTAYGPTLNLADLMDELGETEYGHWLELDRVLAQLWESHSIRPRVLHFAPSGEKERESNSCVHALLPEITRRGIADLVIRG